MEDEAVQQRGVHVLMWLALKHRLDLLENLQLELEKIVVIHSKQLLDALGCHAPDLLVLVRQLGNDQRENVKAIVEVRVAFEQCTETLNASEAQLCVETL